MLPGVGAFCAGIYYTDKALTTDPQAVEYTTWIEYVDKACEYMDALDYELDLISGYAETEGFQKAFENTQPEKFSLIPTASALDSEEIIMTFDGAKAGEKLKAVADLLGKDMEYAYQALQVANGEITAESWNGLCRYRYAYRTGVKGSENGRAGGGALCGSCNRRRVYRAR